jgi:hypothetical protein
MTYTEQRPAESISLLVLTVVAVAIALAPAAGATYIARGKHSCLSNASHRRSVHASRERRRHGKAVRCVRARRRHHRNGSDAAGHQLPFAGGGSEGRQATWTAVHTPPLSDAQATALVRHKPEQRPGNAAANDYVPSSAELLSFHTAVNEYGQSAVQLNPLKNYVDGLDGMTRPSTDDLIQWGARKWGIPEDWLRAQYVLESRWNQSQLGDRASVSSGWYALYPLQAQIGVTGEVFQSIGITMVKWKPDNSVGPGSEPLRWKSTAFNIDFQAADVRYFYDGYCGWCTSGYSPGQRWNSIGAWYEPYPWRNAGARSYIASVRKILAEKPWLSSKF